MGTFILYIAPTNKDRSVWGTNHDLIRRFNKPGPGASI